MTKHLLNAEMREKETEKGRNSWELVWYDDQFEQITRETVFEYE